MKKFKKINVGIIGLGRISLHHINNILLEKKISLISICDIDNNKLNKFSKKFKVPGYQSYREMLEKHSNLNLIIIATPSGMHYEHSIEILKKYKKNLIIEKPLALKILQTEKLFEYAKKNKVKIFPVFQNRYNKAVQRVKKSIELKELGSVRIVNVRLRWCRPQKYYNLSPWRGTFSHDGGALTNQGVHFVDLLRYLFGEVDFVNCQMKTLGSKIEVEDTVVATIGFKKGGVGTLEITTAARPDDYEASLSIIGSKGLAQIGGLAVNNLEIFTPNKKDQLRFSENIPNAYGFGHRYLYKSIKDYFFKNKNYIISEQDCINTIKLLHCFYNSASQNKRVYFNRVKDFKKLGQKNEKISKLYRFNEN